MLHYCLNQVLHLKTRNYLCSNMIDKIKADNPNIEQINFSEKCPKNTIKVLW